MQLIFERKRIIRDKVVTDKYGDVLVEDDLILVFIKNKYHLFRVLAGNKALSLTPSQKNIDLTFIQNQHIIKLEENQ